MKNECSIVRDLLPLYAEHMTSDETDEFIEAHLSCCDSCRAARDSMSSGMPDLPECGPMPLDRLARKMKRQRIRLALMTAVLVALVSATCFSAMTAPEYLPYTAGLLTVSAQGDTQVVVSLPRYVADYAVESAHDPETGLETHRLQIWTTAWSRIFPGSTNTITIPVSGPDALIYYVQGNGAEDVCIWGQTDHASGTITLPRLVLGYYLLLAAAMLIACLTVRPLLRRRFPAAAAWLRHPALLSGCYIAAHLFVCGFQTISYSAARDFLLIILIAILLDCAMQLLYGFWQERTEIRRISEL